MNPEQEPDPMASKPPVEASTAADVSAKSKKPVAGGDAPMDEAWAKGTMADLLQSAYREQRAARRWKIFFRFLWAILFIWMLWIASHPPGMGKNEVTRPHTALIDIHGEISSDTPSNARWLMGSLQDAFEDKDAKAVVLLINSPGGSPVQAGLINDEIHRLKAKHNKPVYVVCTEACASAAYYIAVAADRIYVNKASVVGSIGVLMDGFGFTGLMDKLGVERRLLTAGDNKGLLDPFTPLDSKQKAFAQAMLDDIHRQFIEVVKQGRGDRLKGGPEVFSGLFWTGDRAVELGLADALGSLDSVARDIVQAEEIIDYTRSENVAERLVKRFGMSVGAGLYQSMNQTQTLPR
jgi:protease-4